MFSSVWSPRKKLAAQCQEKKRKKKNQIGIDLFYIFTLILIQTIHVLISYNNGFIHSYFIQLRQLNPGWLHHPRL